MTGAGVRTKIAVTVRDGFHGSQVLTVTAGEVCAAARETAWRSPGSGEATWKF